MAGLRLLLPFVGQHHSGQSKGGPVAGVCPKTCGKKRKFLPLKIAEHDKGLLCLTFAQMQEEMGPGGCGKKVPQEVCHYKIQRGTGITRGHQLPDTV